MANHVLLDNKSHLDLKINTKHSSELGDNISNTLTFPTEFVDVQREYPILFSKNPETGAFQSVALFGLKQNENLFLQANQWNASYIPAIMAKGPFLIGFEEQKINGEMVKEAKVGINLDHPRVSKNEGELLFKSDGEASAYLTNVSRNLMLINDGMKLSKAMFSAFTEHNLIEPVTLNVELNNAEKICIEGNYTINEEKLNQLDGNALAALNAGGFLQMAFAVIASLHNIQKLVELKNNNL